MSVLSYNSATAYSAPIAYSGVYSEIVVDPSALVGIDTAKLHLNVVGTDDDAMIALYLSAAEQLVAGYAQRNVYPNQSALDSAVSAAPSALAAASAAYDASMLVAESMAEGMAKEMASFAADRAISSAQQVARMALQGIVINNQIRAAILLALGHLYANREDVVVGSQVASLPMGSMHLMAPFRAY